VRVSKSKGFVVAIVAVFLVAAIYAHYQGNRIISDTTHSDNAVPSDASNATPLNKPEITSHPTISKVVIPKNFQFVPIEEVPEVDSMDAWMARFSPADQVKLRKFSDLYFGLYEVAGPGQIKWMEEHGYPLPEDVLAAASYATDQLKEMANQGNDKAKMLLLDRLIDNYIEQRDAFVSAGRPRTEFNMTDGQDLMQELMSLLVQLDHIDSPFAALMTTRHDELLQKPDVVASEATRIAGILAAHQLGDTRSTAMLQYCVNAGLCSAEDVSVGLSTALSVKHAAALNIARSGCSQLIVKPMPSE
jgi:hypothetical protein